MHISSCQMLSADKNSKSYHAQPKLVKNGCIHSCKAVNAAL
jgi:hypothetical protein